MFKVGSDSRGLHEKQSAESEPLQVGRPRFIMAAGSARYLRYILFAFFVRLPPHASVA